MLLAAVAAVARMVGYAGRWRHVGLVILADVERQLGGTQTGGLAQGGVAVT